MRGWNHLNGRNSAGVRFVVASPERRRGYVNERSGLKMYSPGGTSNTITLSLVTPGLMRSDMVPIGPLSMPVGPYFGPLLLRRVARTIASCPKPLGSANAAGSLC